MYKLLLIRIKGQLLKINEFQMSSDHTVNSQEQACRESRNGLGWKGPLRSSSSNPLLQRGTQLSRPGCSQPHPAPLCFWLSLVQKVLKENSKQVSGNLRF